MKHKITLGVVCLARKTFDYHAAQDIYNAKKEELKRIENVDWVWIEDLVIETKEADEAANTFTSVGVDGIVIISGTFHLGHLALILDNKVRKPILLWPFDELPYNGGKIRLNSICGMNLNASNLYKSGNDTFSYCVESQIDENWIDAIRIKVAMEKANIGLVGYRAHGFFNLDIDELNNFKKTGTLINHYEIEALYHTKPSEVAVQDKEKQLREVFDTTGVTDDQIYKVAYLAASAKEFMTKHDLTAVAIRCWPEFATTYGIAPCAAMSILQSEGYIMGCEGDIEGTLSMIACRAVGAQTPFLADLSQVNFEEDYALMWHCGVAPANLWDQKCVRSLDTYFAGGKGVTADFVLKSGPVSVVRIDSARGKTRVFVSTGEAIPMSKDLRGTYAKVRFIKPIKSIIDMVIKSGLAHHVSMVYGDFIKPFIKYAEIMGMEVIE